MKEAVKKIQTGISLIEILVVITIFSILGIIITRSIILSLQGTKKSEGMVAARENLDHAMSIIERHIRGSKEIFCPVQGGTQLNYIDQYENVVVFACFLSGEDSYIASGSATLQSRLTSNSVQVSACSFVCEDEDNDPATPPKYVNVSIEAKPVNLSGPQSSTVSTQNRIYLRNY